MIIAVIPAKNEAAHITEALNQLRYLPVDKIIPVLNGCTDETRLVAERHCLHKKMMMLQFAEPLGLDVPRAVGARYAYELGASAVLFLDGDMAGLLEGCLYRLLKGVVSQEYDLTLTNCYPYLGYRSAVAQQVLCHRERLNRTLGVFTDLGLATPSHGPHCVSRKLLQGVDWEMFAVPPMMLAEAVKQNLRIKVAASLAGEQWRSAQRGDGHNAKIADTIIGDCIAAEQYFLGHPIDRTTQGKCYLGYHPERRLQAIADGASTGKCW